MASKLTTSKRVLLIGTAVAIFLPGLLLLFTKDPVPCPPGYTQAQINATLCDNGPFIGDRFSLAFFIFFAIIGFTIIVALLERKPKK